ncbi:mechanosensitive ion channel [Candidatus Haliotispira prima]|uniref:Mechanosensitive ion channel n=1 Tax=Candidatus Haliotispira prima TaxID=3034016 RepID=A0ABY8MIB4_9SPIO|nr:mechanosensitive ion channel [Candidatus Haliotispira prima]
MQAVLEQILTAQFLVEGVLPLFLWLLAYYTVAFFLRRFRKKGLIGDSWCQAWHYLGWVFYSIALYQPVGVIFPGFNESLQQFSGVFTSPLWGKESGPSLLSLLFLLPVFFLSGRLANACSRLFGLYLERNRKATTYLSKSNIQPLLTLSRYILILIFFLFGINLVGINLASLGVLIGALGLGVGFGLQSMAANFVSGISLLFNGHIRKGDFIRTPGALGTVERIGLFSTIVLTLEYKNLIVPNQYLLNEIMENASSGNSMVQLHMPVGVAYESDLELVLKLIRQILQRNPYYPTEADISVFKGETRDEAQSGVGEEAESGGKKPENSGVQRSAENREKTGQSTAKVLTQPEKMPGEQSGSSVNTQTAEVNSLKTKVPGSNVGGEGTLAMGAARKTAENTGPEPEPQAGSKTGALGKTDQWADRAQTFGNDVWLKEFGASAINFEVRMMIENISAYRPATHWFYMEVWKIFRDHGITIPFTQVDLHVHNADAVKAHAVTGFGS